MVVSQVVLYVQVLIMASGVIYTIFQRDVLHNPDFHPERNENDDSRTS